MSAFTLANDVGDVLSLVLIFAALMILATAALRTRTVRSFQTEMLAFVIILFAAEIPEIFSTLGLVNLAPIQDIGEELHAASMVILTAFVALRVYGFMKKK